MIMMVAPNSLARQKEGVQGKGEEEAGDKKKVRLNRNSYGTLRSKNS